MARSAVIHGYRVPTWVRTVEMTCVEKATPYELVPLAYAIVQIDGLSRCGRRRRTPDDIDDERFIAGWSEVALAIAERYGLT